MRVQMWACVRRSRRATLEETTLNLNAGERDKDASTGLSSYFSLINTSIMRNKECFGK